MKMLNQGVKKNEKNTCLASDMVSLIIDYSHYFTGGVIIIMSNKDKVGIKWEWTGESFNYDIEISAIERRLIGDHKFFYSADFPP